MAYFLNGEPININVALTFGDITYPAGYFRNEQRRELAGITYVPDPEPEPVEPEPEPIPTSCSPAQGMVALYVKKGITEGDILTAISNIPDEQTRYLVSVAYNKATEWVKTSDAFQMLASLLLLTEPDLDELFAFAVGVNV